jgi:hypothetical protein
MVFNLSDLESVVGPLPYTLAEGVEETVRWMRSEHGNRREPAHREAA